MIPALLPCILSALGTMGALGLFLSLKRDLRSQARKHQVQIAELKAQLNELDGPIQPPPSGVNLDLRVHALQLVRQGEDAESIAALGLPPREVELLMRIHRN